jgi:ABC-2 type transport system ATP-binding protein
MSAGVVERSQESAPAVVHTAPSVVVVEHLARRFGTRPVLIDVSFRVSAGMAVGIAGANGSGKTVLLRLLASLDRPTSGRATIHGFDTVQRAQAVRSRVGYVSEEPMLYDGLTADQYLQFVGKARGLGKQVRALSVDTLLQVVGLDERRAFDIATLSPGERRRLALAAALIHEPDVLLLDDPLRGLDGFARLEQLEVLRELRRLGTAMVVTATRPEDVLEFCDQLSVLRGGTLTWTGTIDDARALAEPGRSDVLRVRAEVLEGLDPGLALLGQHRDVSELEVEDDGQTVWFLFRGDREQLAGMLPQLVRAGCTVAHFGVERHSPAGAISALFRESA